MSAMIQAGPSRILPKGLPQVAALLIVFLVNWLVFRDFFALRLQDGRLFGSLIDVLNRGAPVAILALGMTLVIATRGIDLSVGAVMAIAGATAATLTAQGYPLPAALAAAAGVGLACGLWNGFLVAVLEIQPFVATLILMVAGRGFAQLITEGQIITFVSEGFAAIGGGSFLMLPMPVVIAIVMLIITHFIVRYTALGLFIESIGANVRSSAYAGIGTKAVTIAVYMWCSLCAAIAGLIVTADIRGADANNAGLWLELDAILAVVIGGTSLFGGRFSLGLSVIGAFIIQSIQTGIFVSGLPPTFNLIVQAVVILAILFLQSGEFRRLFVRIG